MATVQETVQSGIIPIVIELNDVVFFESSERLSRTFLNINSLDLGVLTYKQYRFVARRTKQANQLAERHLTKLMRIIPTLVEERPEISCYIVPIYSRLLKNDELVDILVRALSLYPDAHAGRICLELSSDILYEDLGETRASIEKLRSLGFKIAISEVGDEFCPIFRLAEIDFDYVFLDDFAIQRLMTDEAGERVVGGLVSYIKSLGARVFAPDICYDATASALRRVGCDGCVGSMVDRPEADDEMDADTVLDTVVEDHAPPDEAEPPPDEEVGGDDPDD